jgi:hypothetical protein
MLQINLQLRGGYSILTYRQNDDVPPVITKKLDTSEIFGLLFQLMKGKMPHSSETFFFCYKYLSQDNQARSSLHFFVNLLVKNSLTNARLADCYILQCAPLMF